jgi:hypothetical protein
MGLGGRPPVGACGCPPGTAPPYARVPVARKNTLCATLRLSFIFLPDIGCLVHVGQPVAAGAVGYGDPERWRRAGLTSWLRPF